MTDGGAALLMWFVVLVIMLLVAGSRGGGPGKSGSEWRPGSGADGTPERPFKPTLAGPGIAIDTTHGWLWLATKEKGGRLIDRADVRAWTHEWQSMPNGQKWHNELTFRLSDLQTPVVRVAFGRNHRLAEEWQARLTTWMNG